MLNNLFHTLPRGKNLILEDFAPREKSRFAFLEIFLPRKRFFHLEEIFQPPRIPRTRKNSLEDSSSQGAT